MEIITPMSLGDIFDRTFKMFGKTFLRGLTIAVIVIVPAALLMVWGMTSALSALGEAFHGVRAGEQLDADAIQSLSFAMASALPLVMLGGLVMVFATQALYVSIIEMVAGEMMGEPVSWHDAFGDALRGKMWKAFFQQIIQQFIFSMLFIIPYMLLIFSIVAMSNGGGMGSTGMISFLLFPVAGVVGVYLWVRWIYGVPAIAVEDAGILQSLGRSGQLVSGRWWRTLGILVLLMFVAQLVISLLSFPVLFFGLAGVFRAMPELSSQAQPDPSMVFEAFSNAGVGLGIYILFVSILSGIIMPVILTVMYFDARARKGEFDEIDDPDIDIQILS
jgi:hypothetical protein